MRNTVFAAPPDDPRARRAADGIELAGALAVLVLGGWVYRSDSDLDARVLAFFSNGLPGWLSATCTVLFILGGLYAAVLLIGIALFGRGRHALVRDIALSAVVAMAMATIASRLAGPEWPDIFPELLERNGIPSYPVVRLSMAVAIVRVANPYLSVPMRKVGRQLLAGMMLAALVLSYGTVSAIVGAIAMGAASSAIIHLLFGSGVGIPSRSRLIDGLDSMGFGVHDLTYPEEQPIGAVRVRAELDDGSTALVKVYGRDAADAETTARLWRRVWYLDADRALTASGVQQAEHEALMLHEARSAGVPVPDLLGWGRGPTDDAFVVTNWPDGVRLAALDAHDVTDTTLARCWEALLDLHAARIVHRSLDRDRIVVEDDVVVLRDLAAAESAVTDHARSSDVAQMLVATAVAAGPERAIDAARAGIGDTALADALPLLQSAALPTSLQTDLRQSDLDMKAFRHTVAEALGAEEPELTQLARVGWGNVAMTVLTLGAGYALLSSLANVGFSSIADELGSATWGWLALAFVLGQLTNVGEWLTLTGVVPGVVPLGPTLQFRYALSFISLAVPGDAGAIAMNVRYMQKLGVEPAAAIGQGPLITVISKLFDILLLVIASRALGQTVDLSDADTGPVLRLLMLIVVLIIVGIGLTLGIPKLRAKVVPAVREAFTSIRDSVTDPRRVLRMASGTLMQKILFAMTLGAVVAGFGETISFTEALFVNSAVSLFIGLIPVPGGVGVGEAAIASGLTLMGVPEGAAIAAAVTHRMITAYLPPIYGWFASRWLTARDYL